MTPCTAVCGIFVYICVGFYNPTRYDTYMLMCSSAAVVAAPEVLRLNKASCVCDRYHVLLVYCCTHNIVYACTAALVLLL